MSKAPTAQDEDEELEGSGATPFTDIEDALRERGVYYISGDITSSNLKPIHQDILLKHLTPTWEDDHPITLVINSAGGDLGEAWALIDLLNFVRMPITTIGIGECLSAACLLLASGTIGKRILSFNTTVMMHRFTWGTYDKQAELVEHRRAQDASHKRMLRFLLRKTVYKTRAGLEKHLLRPVDTWLTAKEAVAHGLADHILLEKTERFNHWTQIKKRAARDMERMRKKKK